MGWNQVYRPQAAKCPLLNGIKDGEYMYFVHSYYVLPKDRDVVATYTDYGKKFVSGIWKENLFAFQFHPEKSQRQGLKILENFVRL